MTQRHFHFYATTPDLCDALREPLASTFDIVENLSALNQELIICRCALDLQRLLERSFLRLTPMPLTLINKDTPIPFKKIEMDNGSGVKYRLVAHAVDHLVHLYAGGKRCERERASVIGEREVKVLESRIAIADSHPNNLGNYRSVKAALTRLTGNVGMKGRPVYVMPRAAELHRNGARLVAYAEQKHVYDEQTDPSRLDRFLSIY